VGGVFLGGGLITFFTAPPGVALVLIIAGAALFGCAFFFAPLARSLDSRTTTVRDAVQRALQPGTGVPAKGRILAAQPTGTMEGPDPEMTLTVEVDHPQKGRYQAQAIAVVPHASLPKVQVGAQVDVRVNVFDPQAIMVIV
jgi:hypothetical protein